MPVIMMVPATVDDAAPGTLQAQRSDGDRGRMVQQAWAVLLALVAMLLLCVSTWWLPASGSGWQLAAQRLADQLWPLLLVGMAAVVGYRTVLRPWIAREFARLFEQARAGGSPPRDVMVALLSRIYGETRPTDDVVVGVLGGAGADPRGVDLSISSHTTVDYALRRVDRRAYELKLTVQHSFKEDVTDQRFAIFATCDPQLRDSIALARRLPLYEEWFVPNPELFEMSVDEIASSAHIGIDYTDLDGSYHQVAATKVVLTEVSYGDWPEYLTLFREPVGAMPKQSPDRYMRTLRIFEFDLGELADADHTVGSIRSMSLTSTSLQPLEDPFCYWQAPYPCYVERVKFDAADLNWEGDAPRLFRVVPFTFR